MKQNITIAVLIAIILLLIFYIDPLNGAFDKDDEVDNQQHVQQIDKAQIDIINILKREMQLIKKIKDDSIRHAKEKAAFRQQIARYKRKIAEIHYDTATSEELDSIRLSIYKPGDSTYIVAGPDPLYSMPISQARDALEAKAREPLYDSINALQDLRIDSLESQGIAREELFKAQLNEMNLRFEASKTINDHLQAMNENYRKKEKRQAKKKWVDRAVGALFGFAAGKL